MSKVLAALRDALGDRVCADESVRAAHRRDTWVLGELRDFEGHAPPLPVASPKTASFRPRSSACSRRT